LRLPLAPEWGFSAARKDTTGQRRVTRGSIERALSTNFDLNRRFLGPNVCTS
jgi:hypothetical protein